MPTSVVQELMNTIKVVEGYRCSEDVVYIFFIEERRLDQAEAIA